MGKLRKIRKEDEDDGVTTIITNRVRIYTHVIRFMIINKVQCHKQLLRRALHVACGS